MEIRFYSPEMDFLGVMENQTSLIWTRKYYEPGEIELYAPITASNLRLTALGNLVWMKGCKEAAVIEDRKLEESNIKREITVKGRFLSSYLDRRLIKGTMNYSGTVEGAMRKIVSDATAIPRVKLGSAVGFEETVAFQATYKNALTYEEKLSRGSGIGFRLRPDFNEKALFFEAYKGTDRTASQHEVPRVIFSGEYSNLNNVIQRVNDQSYKTVAYVGGEGEGSARTIVKVGDASGLELREVFVDARDLRSENMSADAYKNALRTRGRESLASNRISDSIECDTGADANFLYKVHYDLGDIVTIRKKDWGVSIDQRITEIREIYEYGGRRIEPTLGDALPETIDWSE